MRYFPVTWVADYSEHIGNTFGPNRFAIGSSRNTSSRARIGLFIKRARSVVRQRLTQFDRAKIWRRPDIAICHLRDDQALVHRRRSGFQPEIKILHLVQLLNGPDVLGVKRAHTLEGVVIDEDAVLILVGIRVDQASVG